MKKAQVTIFIIIGILILIVFFILYSMTGLTAEQKQVISQARQQAGSDAVNRYVTSCLENSFEEAVLTLADNGGWIYEVAGCDANTCTSAGSINNASYGITLNPDIDMPPKYPCIDESQSWPFCSFYYDADNPRLAVYGKKWLPMLGTGPNSIKEQLEKYTAKKVLQCIDFSKVQGLSSQTYNVRAQNAYVDVEIRASDVRATLNLPIVINYQGKSATEMKTFSIEKNIRLSLMHKFIDQLLFYDNSDLGFDAATEYTNLTWYFGGMRFNISYNEKGLDDLITVSDNESIVRNRPLMFRIARQNLPPVLNYIHGFATKDFDFILFDNQTLVISPEAFDANEDDLGISYSGWKINYDEVFDGTGVQRTEIAASVAAMDKGNFSILLTKQDLGPHNLTVYVTDGEYTDYQIVRILVDDKIHIEAYGSNPYTDIPDEFASIEDPYHFEAVTTDIYNAGANYFQWFDPVEPPVLYEGEAESFWIPGPVEKTTAFYDSVQIDKIENPFNIPNTIHEITARVTAASIGNFTNFDADVIEVRVRECLGHRSDIPPYPYHETENFFDNYTSVSSDPFMGSHTCCTGDAPSEWEIAATETVCYSFTQYGKFSLIEEPEIVSEAYQGFASTYPDNGDENDIYARTYERTCDGTRGNMCAGPDRDTVMLYRRCNDCQAPPRLYSLSSEPMECFNLEGFNYKGEPCDKEWKCSGLAYGDGYGSLCQGGCDGSGSCTGKINCLNPLSDARHMQCIGSQGAFMTYNCSCELMAGNDEIGCSELDLDGSKELCEICTDNVSWANTTCCGDDQNEYFVNETCCDEPDDCVLDGYCYDRCFEIGGNICKDNMFQPKTPIIDSILCLFA